MRSFKLQPLRIPTGWHIKYNALSEYDIIKDGAEYSYELCEDMLQVENQNLLIDLGWYPSGDIEGNYKLYMLDKNEECPFESPLEIFISKSKQEVTERIEYWTDSMFYSKYIR